MVTERDPQPPADVGQLRRPYSPLGSGELHGTRERRPWQAQPVPGATGMQDAPVERRVVGGDERRVVDPGAERRPQLGEGRRVVHVLPVQAVEVGERKLRGGRTDQVGSREDDPAVATGRPRRPSLCGRPLVVLGVGGGLERTRLCTRLVVLVPVDRRQRTPPSAIVDAVCPAISRRSGLSSYPCCFGSSHPA